MGHIPEISNWTAQENQTPTSYTIACIRLPDLVMAISLLFLPAILAFFCVCLAHSNALIDCETPSCYSNGGNEKSVAGELEDAELRIVRLESILEERIGDINAKSQYLSECERKIEELTLEIDRFKEALSSFGDGNEKLIDLEEEVRLLWATSRKNNFDIHALEYEALDAERRLQEVTDQVVEMAEIVSEQWIQIQQLEQAVHMAEVRTIKVKRESGWRRCPVMKSANILLGDFLDKLKKILYPYAPTEGSALAFFKSQYLQVFSAVKHYHHQLQGYIQQAMQSNEFTAALAHEEVVFIVASALVAFPIMSACMLLLSQFS